MSMPFAAQINSVMASLILLTAFGLLIQRRMLAFSTSSHGRDSSWRSAPASSALSPATITSSSLRS